MSLPAGATLCRVAPAFVRVAGWARPFGSPSPPGQWLHFRWIRDRRIARWAVLELHHRRENGKSGPNVLGPHRVVPGTQLRRPPKARDIVCLRLDLAYRGL